MKKTLLALALAGIATASFGFTIYSNDVASLTLSSSLKAQFGYNLDSTKVDYSKIEKHDPKTVTTTTNTPNFELDFDKLDFAGTYTLGDYQTGFDLKLKVLNNYEVTNDSSINSKVETESLDGKKETKETKSDFKATKYEAYKFTSLSSTPFKIYFKAPTFGTLTLGVNKSGIELDEPTADVPKVNQELDGSNKYLLQYDSFKFFTNFEAGASLTFTKSDSDLTSAYAGYVTYNLPNSDTVKVTGLNSANYSYKANGIRVLNQKVGAYQVAYTNNSLMDNLSIEVAFQHNSTRYYNVNSLADQYVADQAMSFNQNSGFIDVNYTFNDYLQPYFSVSCVHQQSVAMYANKEHNLGAGLGLNSTLYSGYGVKVTSNLEADYKLRKVSPVEAKETSVATTTSNTFNFTGYLKLAF